MAQQANGVEAAAEAACANLAVLNAPNAAPSQIAAANATLIRLNATLPPDAALPLATHLLSPLFSSSTPTALTAAFGSGVDTIPLPHAQFAFLILDTHLLSPPDRPYAEVPAPLRDTLRQLATALLRALDPERHPALLREKAVSLVAALAIREWPQRWPDFLETLISPSTPPHTACRALHHVSDDVHVHEYSNGIEKIRLTELRRALAHALPTILPFITTLASNAHSNASASLLTAALHCLRSFVTWADLPSLISAGVPQACITLLGAPVVREEALAVLDALVARNIHPTRHSGGDPPADIAARAPDHAVRHILFGALQQYLASSPLFLPLLANAATRASAENVPFLQRSAQVPIVAPPIEDHQFMLGFVSLMAELGARHFSVCFLLLKKDEAVKLYKGDEPVARAYVDTLALLLSGPSQAVRVIVLKFFASVVSTILRATASTARLSKLLQFIVTTAFHAGSASLVRVSRDQAFAVFAELDDDEQHPTHQLRSRTTNMIRSAARFLKDREVEVVGLLFAQLTGKPQIGETLPPPPPVPSLVRAGVVVPLDHGSHAWRFGSFTAETSLAWVACTQTAIEIFDIVLNVSPKPTAELQRKLEAIMHAVLNLTEPRLRRLRDRALRSLPPLYFVLPAALSAAITCLLNASSVGSKVDRSQSLNALATIFNRVQSLDNSRFGTALMSCAKNALESRHVTTSGRIHAVEAALCVILAQPEIEVRSAAVEQLVEPPLQALITEVVKKAFSNPKTLFSFLHENNADADSFIATAALVEVIVHSVIRPMAKKNSPLELPGTLSRAVAPRAAIIAAEWITMIHGLFNQDKFWPAGGEAEWVSALHPSCRELIDPLNLENAESVLNEENPDCVLPLGPGDEKDGLEEPNNQDSSFEMRCEALIRAADLQPPDPQHRRLRERLRELRRMAYELARAAIFSGATASQMHATALINAVCSDYVHIEPMHLHMLLTRVVAPMFSFTVCASAPGHLGIAATESQLPELFLRLAELVKAAHRNMDVFSATKLLDASREYGLSLLPRASAELIMGMYPRRPPAKKGEPAPQVKFIPPALQAGKLSEALMVLWTTICSPGQGILDKGASNLGFRAVNVAVDMADDSMFSMFSGLCAAAFQTAVMNSGEEEVDPSSSEAVNALASLIKKWPDEFQKTLCASVGDTESDIRAWIKQTVDKKKYGSGLTGFNDKVTKKIRIVVKELVDRVARHKGTYASRARKVHALPEKMVTENVARKMARLRNDGEDVELADHALDSLFGEGEPL